MELPRPVAFVLSGGAALGALQVGMLRAILEQGLSPDLVVGTSVGALNGAVLCETPTLAVERLADVWVDVRRSRVFPWTMAGNVRVLSGRRTHLFANTGVGSLIDRALSAEYFSQLAVPLTVVTTDAMTGHPILVDDGPLRPALLASTAIPGLLPPVQLGGTVLVDGGLAQNVPLLPALTRGASSVVVLDAAGFCHRSQPARNLMETLVFASSLLLRHQVSRDVADAARDLPVLYPPGPCLVGRSPLDFGRSAELIELGYAHVREFLGQVEVTGPGLYGQPHHHDAESQT